MDPKELLQWLQSLRPWIQTNTTARQKVDELITKLKQHLGMPL